MRNLRYHAEIRFSYTNRVRFTAVDLELLMKRFNAEVEKEVRRRRDAREYTYVEPNLVVEVCSSWSSFDSYEHAFA